ncbi:MAG TPA: carboxypeptidase regulatory-like domain-containing protein [Candidatus Acidoferrum sp.]|nr:carboxypeptidase regulatory-like domain-containing protein [Candidatus Acidoferrum sp.]
MNWKFFAALPCLLLAVIALACQPAWAQANVQAGSIQGVVSDPNGGVIPGAAVTITRKDTGQVSSLKTTSAGTYSSGSLTPGVYSVRVQAANFQTYETTVTVVVGQITAANVKMSLGSSSSVIEVTGSAVQVNTEQAQIAGTVTTQQIENLPINGRNFLDIAQLEPGVQIQDGGNFDPTKIGFSSISFGGRFGRSARIQVDGVDISDENVGTTTSDIPASAISEFQLAQSSLDLSNDLTSSGAVNVVTKSGTNDFHGQAFGLFRDSSQAAIFPGGAQFQRSQYGGDVGGPIIKDKLFFFVDGEKLLAHDLGGVSIANVPSGIDSTNLNSFNGTYPAPFHDGTALGRIDYQATSNLHLFARFNYFQNLDVGNFGGAANYSVYANKDRTKDLVGGADFTTGAFTHSIRAEYLKFVNVIADAVVGSDLPFADLPVSTDLTGTGFASGPSDLAPQSTIQSDRQIKYDGSRVWGAHIIRWGVDYNRITGWSFASFVGITPLAINVLGADPAAPVVCPGGQTGAACPLNYTPDELLLGNGQGAFTELQRFGKPNGGLGPDNRIGVYLADSWKVRKNVTVTIGARYDRDTARTDSDLPPIPAINNLFPGLGNTVRQPNTNIAPQLGIAWDPWNDGKTVIRGSIGLFYDNTVFNDILFDRLLKLPTGAFNIVPAACFFGTAFPVTFGGTTGNEFIGGSSAAGNTACSTDIGATVGAAGGTCAGQTFAACAGAFEKSYQASWAANPTGPNASYIPNEIATGSPITTGLLYPGYRSPESLQMNFGFQRQIRPGMVFSGDYIRNVGEHYLLGVDVNHTGDAAYFNPGVATTIRDTVNGTFGCGTGSAGVNCAIGKGATIADYAGAGLDSPADLGIGACPINLGTQCAFGGINPNVGSFIMYEPVGRSVYNAMDLKITQNVRSPFRGVKYLNFVGDYTLSRFVNAGSTSAGVAGGDQDFVANALNDRNPEAYMGPSSLDRTHQFNFGGYADVPYGFRLGIVSHFWSPLAVSPSVPTPSSTGAIFTTDYAGSGVTGGLLPTGVNSSCGTVGGVCDYTQYNVGAFGRQVGGTGLVNAINNYNNNIAGILPTPAGQALINNQVFTLAQLQELGGVAAPVSTANPAIANPVGLGWLKAFDLEISWVKTFNERFSIEPSVSMYNLFNFSNFNSVANAESGALTGAAGSINGTTTANRDAQRIGAGTGVFQLGAPRVIEWGLKFTF